MGTKFDAAVWNARVWRRFSRTLTSGRRRPTKEEHAWFFDVLAVSDIARLEDWIKKRGVKLEFTSREPNGKYDHEKKLIVVSSNLRPTRQAVVIVHECGHHLVDTARGKALCEPNNFRERVEYIEDEFEAWKRGSNLAIRLELKMSETDFQEYKLECVKTYMKWVVDPKKWE